MTTSAPVHIQQQGMYLRRLLDATATQGGIQARVSLINFRDIGDERHRVIVSDEPLVSQTIDTNTPNRPSEAQSQVQTSDTAPSASNATLLNVQVLSPRIVRVRLGNEAELAAPRDYGMLVPNVI